MFRIKVILSIFLLVSLICTAGCGAKAEETDGISGTAGNYRYRVELSGADIEDIFTLVGIPGYIHITKFSGPSLSSSHISGTSGANYCEVEEGGWVAYTNSEFIYMPNETNSRFASQTGALLASSTEDIMSLDEFWNYFNFD